MTFRDRLLPLAAVALPLMLAAPGLQAHHGWGEYDSGTVLNVSGTVETSSYGNPHGHLQLRTPEKVWRVILAPPSRMNNRGLSAEMLKPGASVTVEGYQKKSDPVEMRAERITVDGKTVELR